MVLAPCAFSSAAEVVESRAKHADHIQRAVLEESLILRSEHRMHHHRRQIVEPHHAPLFARTVEKIRDQLRLDFSRIELLPFAKAARCAKSPNRKN